MSKYSVFQRWSNWSEACKELISWPVFQTLDEAMQYALSWHGDQRRPNGQLLETHLCEVLDVLINGAQIVEPDVLITAALHDLIENTSCPITEIETRFGKEMARSIDALTLPWKIPNSTSPKDIPGYFQRLASAPRSAHIVRLADRVSSAQHILAFSLEKQATFFEETNCYHRELARDYLWFAQWLDTWALAYTQIKSIDGEK